MAVSAALMALPVLLLPSPATAAADKRAVLVVSNNWEGTADIVDPKRFKRLQRLNIIPDKEERIAEIMADPQKAGFFTGINLLIGEGNNQYVDDSFTSPDGRFLYVSRPSFADVVAFDLGTKRIVWRVPVAGNRSDHMAISKDGRRLLVSASTANVVHEIDTRAGKISRQFESGDQPHENNYSADGKLIYHASIGMVFTPTDDPALDATKGDRIFQIVDARTLNILRRIDVGKKLAEAGHPGMSSAVRPVALSPDERFVYMQVSFFHGFVEYDLKEDRVTRLANLPVSEEARQTPREQYVLDSAHHGIAMNPRGTKLCVAGTMSDYAAIVHRTDFATRIASHGRKPYWSTNSGDGRHCFISYSGDDRVSVVSYAKEKEVASIPVGDHPQRMRMGTMRSAYLPAVRARPRFLRLRVIRRNHARRLRVRVSEPSRLRIELKRAEAGRRFRRVRVIKRRGGPRLRRIGLGRLRPNGRYRVLVRATDRSGNRSRARVLRFATRPLR